MAKLPADKPSVTEKPSVTKPDANAGRVDELEAALAHERFEHQALRRAHQRLLESQSGVMSARHFNQIRKALHPDRVADKAEREAALVLLNQFKQALVFVRKRELSVTAPIYRAHFRAMKRQAQARRKAKREAAKAWLRFGAPLGILLALGIAWTFW